MSAAPLPAPLLIVALLFALGSVVSFLGRNAAETSSGDIWLPLAATLAVIVCWAMNCWKIRSSDPEPARRRLRENSANPRNLRDVGYYRLNCESAAVGAAWETAGLSR